MCDASLFDAVCYIVGASLIVFGLPSIACFALTEYIVKRIERK